MNCKIAARWMSLDGRLPDWLATLRAGVVVKSVERHRELLSYKANRRHAKGVARLDFFWFFLALVDPHKLFDELIEPFRDRHREVDMCLDFPPDGFQKLAALRGLLSVAPRFHGRLPFFPSPGHSGRSRGFVEDLVDAARYRLGAFSGHLVRKCRQLLALFAQHLELLVRMRRPELDDIRWRLGCGDLL
jgi:hypothetical protein